MSSECQISINNNIHHSLVDIMPIFTIPENVLGGNPFVKGSTIIRSVLICSIDTLCFRTYSLKAKYFNSICLAPLEYLSFLEKKTAAKLSQ